MPDRRITTALLTLACAAASVAGPAPAGACSIFTAHDKGTVLVGNNEDFKTEYVNKTKIWYVPGATGKFGYVAWGYEHEQFAQGGMNDQGLFFDILATPTHKVTTKGSKQFGYKTFEQVLQTCATVDQALAMLKQYDLTQILPNAQPMYVDSAGASAIFDGTTVTRGTGGYQVGTNFLPANPQLGGHPCWRHDKLTGMMKSGLKLTTAYFTSMAEAARQGPYTLYTTVCDLKARKFHLFHGGDFKTPLVIDLKAELAKGEQTYNIAKLFGKGADAGPDAGPDAGLDAGADAGADAALPGEVDQGSGCAVAAATRAPRGLLVLLLLVALRRRAS